MKHAKNIVFGLLIVLFGFTADVVRANHDIISVVPPRGNPGESFVEAVIRGDNFGDPRTTLVFLSVNPPQGIRISQRGNHSDDEIPVTIDIKTDAQQGTRNFIVEIQGNTGDASRDEERHAERVRFTIGSGGGTGPPVGGTGTGGVEQVPDRFGGIPEGPQDGEGLVEVVEGLTDWVFVILLVAAVLFIVLAAFQFIAGGGNPTAVAEARNKLIWAAVGIAVALLAKGIPIAIRNVVAG